MIKVWVSNLIYSQNSQQKRFYPLFRQSQHIHKHMFYMYTKVFLTIKLHLFLNVIDFRLQGMNFECSHYFKCEILTKIIETVNFEDIKMNQYSYFLFITQSSQFNCKKRHQICNSLNSKSELHVRSLYLYIQFDCDCHSNKIITKTRIMLFNQILIKKIDLKQIFWMF